MRRETLVAVAVIAALLVVEIGPHDACRILGGGFDGTLLQGLQKGVTPPSGDPCMYTPGQGGPPCLNGRKSFGRRDADKDGHRTVMTVGTLPPLPQVADQTITKLRSDNVDIIAEN